MDRRRCAPRLLGHVPGEERAPAAIRASGLLERLGIEDLGDAHQPIASALRDPDTGVIAFAEIAAANAGVRDVVGRVLDRGGRPLVLGGDCAFLPGALAAAHAHGGPLGVVLVDGHPDCHDGTTSPTGEAADMELAVATGRGPAGLVDLAGPPIVRPEHAVVLGYGRERPEDAAEAELADPAIELVPAAELRGDLPARTRAVAARLAADPGRYWIHLDVDVLDETVLPAVTYPHLDGLGWDEVEAALRVLLEPEGAVAGLSIADYVPPRDPDGRGLEQLTEMLRRLLA